MEIASLSIEILTLICTILSIFYVIAEFNKSNKIPTCFDGKHYGYTRKVYERMRTEEK